MLKAPIEITFFSIRIACCFDPEGKDLLLSKDDIRTRIFETETNSIKIAE